MYLLLPTANTGGYSIVVRFLAFINGLNIPSRLVCSDIRCMVINARFACGSTVWSLSECELPERLLLEVFLGICKLWTAASVENLVVSDWTVPPGTVGRKRHVLETKAKDLLIWRNSSLTSKQLIVSLKWSLVQNCLWWTIAASLSFGLQAYSAIAQTWSSTIKSVLRISLN